MACTVRAALLDAARRHFAAALAQPLRCDGVALFVEDAPGADVPSRAALRVRPMNDAAARDRRRPPADRRGRAVGRGQGQRAARLARRPRRSRARVRAARDHARARRDRGARGGHRGRLRGPARARPARHLVAGARPGLRRARWRSSRRSPTAAGSVLNGSRAHLPALRAQAPGLRVVAVTAPAHVLAHAWPRAGARTRTRSRRAWRARSPCRSMPSSCWSTTASWRACVDALVRWWHGAARRAPGF